MNPPSTTHQGTRSKPKATPKKRNSKSANRGTDPNNNSDTRQRVIEAAIRCILDRGLYRASSNAIAETAGLTWGVIQYYFGSRESLMLAVLDEGNRRLITRLREAHISGDTMSERLENYFDVLEGYYGQPEYLAFIQVLMTLSHDPNTSAQTLNTMLEASEAIGVEIRRLTKELFAGTGTRTTNLIQLPFTALRGMALSEVVLRTLPYDSEMMVRRVSSQRSLLARAIGLLLESEGVEIRS